MAWSQNVTSITPTDTVGGTKYEFMFALAVKCDCCNNNKTAAFVLAGSPSELHGKFVDMLYSRK